MLEAMFKASSNPKVLFLDFHPDGAGSLRKLDGIRRFAKTHGWDVLPIPPDESQPAQVKPLLTRHRPVGCIVEGAGSDMYLPPRLFGKVPVVYLDPPNPTARRTAAAIVCDNAAVARLAFRELSAGMHPCLAVVPSFRLRPWDAARIRTFRALCVDAGIPCKVFGAIRYETGERLVARLADWLVRLPKRSGLFATNDKAALDVVFAPAPGEDCADALQALIDANPQRAIHIPDGVYVLSHPVCTPASPSRAVALRLSDFAILRAAPDWAHTNAMVRLGGKNPANNFEHPCSVYGLYGGVVDGAGVADAISIESGRETRVQNVAIRNARVGIHVFWGANGGSADCDICDIRRHRNRPGGGSRAHGPGRRRRYLRERLRDALERRCRPIR